MKLIYGTTVAKKKVRAGKEDKVGEAISIFKVSNRNDVLISWSHLAF